MGRKIFVSYKYDDTAVASLNFPLLSEALSLTTARSYVDKIATLIKNEDCIYKGEHDGEDLSSFKEETIASSLRDRIYDSSLTLIIISPNMRDVSIPESDQWIPWEVSYSLREQTRNDRTSKTNAALAVVLPNASNRYDYFIKDNVCNGCFCRTLSTNTLFKILSKNMFNVKQPQFKNCSMGTVYHGYSSYIHTVKWHDFQADPGNYFDIADKINQNIDDYEIVKAIV